MRLAFVLALVAPLTARADECDGERQRLHHWAWGWGIANGATMVGQLVAVPFVEADQRVDWYVGAGASGAGVLTVVVPVLQARDCAGLEAAERQGHAWYSHVANVLFNGGLGLLLGLGYDHWRAGVQQAALGTLVGELMIYTQPDAAITPMTSGWGLQIAGRF